MRIEFIIAESLLEAFRLAPWAAEILEAEGGYWAFESIDDAENWQKQV
jgi:hypothetical protein